MPFVQTGLAWLAAKRKVHNSRAVVYRRPSTAAEIPIDASVGQTQMVNLNSLTMEPGMMDAGVLAAQAMNRDYVVSYADLVSIWPPQSGDLIDDEGDIDGTICRYQVMNLPSQDCWRWLSGGLQVQARVHTKFLAEYAPLWSDYFTGSNGTALESHTPNSPDDGAYVGGSGGIVISSNRIVSSDATAYRFYSLGSADVSAQVDVCLNLTTDLLLNKYAEMGLGVRCADSGAGQRDGYYCTLKVGHSNGAQTTRQLKIVSRVSSTDTQVAVVNLPSALSLTETYRMLVECEGARIVFSLLDSTGEVTVASVAYDEAVMTSNESGAVIFTHHASLDFSLPYLDSLVVENVT